MTQLTQKEQEAKKRVCLALDVPTVSEALDLTEQLSGYVGTFKVGKQLHTSACNEGVNIFGEIFKRGGKVFFDSKFHDTPNTVYEASKAAAVPGVFVFNIHVAGGEEMCRKAVQGAGEGAEERGIDRPKVIGVTVLTSLNDEDLKAQNLGISYDALVLKRTELAKEWGLDGIVCPASKAGELEKKFGSDFLYITPGITWGGNAGAGQKQLYTPNMAVRDCKSSILVIGGAITKADDKVATALEILRAMVKEL